MIKQFLNYLTETGMGENENIKQNAVMYYCDAMKLDSQLTAMFTDLVKKDWYNDCPNFDVLRNRMNAPQFFRKRWGRIGIEFCEEWEKISEDSNINIFAGVIVDNYDHRLRNFTSPQLVVLIDCFQTLKKSKNIQNIFKDLPKTKGFEIEKEPANKWRLLILKKPLTVVIKDEDDYKKQKENIYNELKQGISIILDHWNKKQNNNQ